jgi:hypothetical protein
VRGELKPKIEVSTCHVNLLCKVPSGIDSAAHLPRADQWVRGDQFFSSNNGPIAKISENEGSLHLGVCSGCRYWLRNRGRKIGDLVCV